MGTETDVEALIDPGARARLALRRQVRIYLDPFALFKDATRGPRQQRELALSWNRRMRWMLVPYIRRWGFIACALFLGIAPAEAMAAQYPATLVPVTVLAAGSCLAAVVVICSCAAYLLLSRH